MARAGFLPLMAKATLPARKGMAKAIHPDLAGFSVRDFLPALGDGDADFCSLSSSAPGLACPEDFVAADFDSNCPAFVAGFSWLC